MNNEKRCWIVRVRREILCDVYTDECTREEAEKNVWKHCASEREVYSLDFKVLKVEPNE